MSAYADTSFLASLYTPDANSAEAAARMQRLALPVILTPFVELELVNALQLRLFRHELLAVKIRAAYAAFSEDVASGILNRCRMSSIQKRDGWPEILPGHSAPARSTLSM